METPQSPVANITVVDNVYYGSTEGQPYSSETIFSRRVSPERPIAELVEVGEEWSRLPETLLSSPAAMVVFANELPPVQVIPTPEEDAERRSHVLLISTDKQHSWRVRPGESLRGEPALLRNLWVRSERGNTTFQVIVFKE